MGVVSMGQEKRMESTKRSGRRNGRRRGAAFVEAGLVLVPLLAMVVAIMEYSNAIFAKVTLQHAVREGVRYAVTYQTKAGFGHDASIKQIVQANAWPFLTGDTGLSKVFVNYYEPDTFAPTAANAPGNIVEVSVQGYSYKWLAPLMRDEGSITFAVYGMDRMEGLPGGAPPPVR